MATKTYELPTQVSIGNAGSKAQNFQPYRENFNVTLNAGDVVTFDVKSVGEILYYEKQVSGDLISGAISDPTVSISAGSYNSTTNTFTDGATFGIVEKDGVKVVVGTIPYEEADANLGLVAGNRFTVKLSKEGITARTDLPSGVICKVTNTGAAGGYNEYNKMAFETDGSLISVINVKPNSTIEIMVKWTADADFTVYTFGFNYATFAKAE